MLFVSFALETAVNVSFSERYFYLKTKTHVAYKRRESDQGLSFLADYSIFRGITQFISAELSAMTKDEIK